MSVKEQFKAATAQNLELRLEELLKNLPNKLTELCRAAAFSENKVKDHEAFPLPKNISYDFLSSANYKKLHEYCAKEGIQINTKKDNKILIYPQNSYEDSTLQTRERTLHVKEIQNYLGWKLTP